MGRRKKYKTQVWHPFRRDAYHWAWHDKKLFGIIREFWRDLCRCHERIWKGYCDNDIFSIDDWFLGIMPTMLQEFKGAQHGCPTAPGLISHRVFLEESAKEKDEDLQAWNAVLDRMIFLLKEADEETCTRENPYEEEYLKARREFDAQYGIFGEKLMTGEERNNDRNGKGKRLYSLCDVEEYRPLAEKYLAEEKAIARYRCACKDEALELFSKWFYDLWD